MDMHVVNIVAEEDLIFFSSGGDNGTLMNDFHVFDTGVFVLCSAASVFVVGLSAESAWHAMAR